MRSYLSSSTAKGGHRGECTYSIACNRDHPHKPAYNWSTPVVQAPPASQGCRLRYRTCSSGRATLQPNSLAWSWCTSPFLRLAQRLYNKSPNCPTLAALEWGTQDRFFVARATRPTEAERWSTGSPPILNKWLELPCQAKPAWTGNPAQLSSPPGVTAGRSNYRTATGWCTPPEIRIRSSIGRAGSPS